MGITRDKIHKRRATGGKQSPWRKKKKFNMGRQPANTKLSTTTDVRIVRCRGGNKKFRALRLDHGNFAWGSEAISKKVRVTCCTCMKALGGAVSRCMHVRALRACLSVAGRQVHHAVDLPGLQYD